MNDLQKNNRYIRTMLLFPFKNSMKPGIKSIPENAILLKIIYLIILSILSINAYSGTLKSAISLANAGADTTICTDNYVLKASPASLAETGTWTVPAGIIISDINSPTAFISNLVDGNIYELVWTIDDGIDTSKDTVYISYQTTTIANAGGSICKTLTYPDINLPVDLNGNLPTAFETANWTVLSSMSATNDSILDPNAYQTSVKGLSAGKHTLQYSITNPNSGCKESAQLEIIVLNEALINNALTCFPLSGTDTSIALLGNPTISDESVSWTLKTPASTSVIQNFTVSNTTVNGLTRGLHKFQYKIEHDGCKDSALVTLGFTSKAALPGDTCLIENAVLNITGTQPSTIESGIWTADNGMFAAVDNYNGTYSNFAKGSNKVYWSISDSSNICTSVDSMIVTGISEPLSGNDTCIVLEAGQTNKSLVLNKFTYDPLLESVSNYSIDGDSIVGYGQDIPVILGIGQHSFVSIVTNIASGCQKKDTVTFTIINKALAGPVQCLIEPISSVQLNAESLSAGEVGEWKSPLLLSFDDINSATATINNPPSGVLLLTWVISNGSCQDSSTTSVSIISAAQVGNDTCVLADATVPIQAIAVDENYQSGQWSIVQGGGLVIDPLKESSLYTATAKGINQLVWSVVDTVGICSSTDTMTVVSISEPNAGIDQCISTNTAVSTINLQANAPFADETGFWVNADSVSTILSYSAIDNISLPVGRHVLIWNIQNNNSACVKSDTAVITIIQKPNAGPNQCLVEPIASVQLDASNFTNSQQTGIWTSITPLNFNDSGIPNAIISNPPSGTVTLTWLVENAGCKDSSSVKISIISNADASSDVCIRLDSATQKESISAIGINTIYQKGEWIAANSNLQNGNPYILSDPNLNVTSVSNLNIGTNKFYWTVTDTSGICSNRDSVVVTAISKPVAMGDLCLSSDLSLTNVNLSANNFFSGIETGYWTNKDSATIKVGLSNVSVQQLPRGVNNFYWTIENQLTACTYSDSVSVTILPNSDAGPDLCLKEGTSPITLDGNNFNTSLGETGTWSPNSLVNFTNLTDPETNITPLSSGVHTLTWTIQNNGCKDSATVKVSIISQPQAGADICLTDKAGGNTDTLRSEIYNTSYQTGMWYLKSGSGLIADAGSSNSYVENLSIGNNKFIWEIKDTIGFCSFQDSLTITVLTKPVATSANCYTALANQSGTVSVKGNNYNSIFEEGYWINQSNVHFADSSLLDNFVTVAPGVYQFVWNIENILDKSCSISDTVEVVMLSKPKILESNKFPYCINGSSIPVSLNSDTAWGAAGETGFWSVKNKRWSDVSNSDSTNSLVGIFTDNIGIHNLFWSVENLGCVSRDSIELSILSSPDAGPDRCIPYNNDNQTSINLKADSIDYAFESGRWAIMPGSASFFTATLQGRDSSNAIASGLLKGIDRYLWTITDKLGRCSQSDTVTYALITPPENGPDLCRIINQGASAVNIALKGNSPENSELGNWSSVQPMVFSNFSSTTANVQLAQGHYQILWSISNPGLTTCRLSDTLNVTVISQAIAGEKQCLATPAVNAVLKGNALNPTSNEIGTWYRVSTKSNVKIDDPNSPISFVSELTTGVHRLKWVVSNNGCKDSSYTNLVLITKPNAGGNKCLPYEGDNTLVTLTGNNTTVADVSSWVPATNSLSGVSINPNKNVNEVTVFTKGAFSLIYRIRDTSSICPFLGDTARVTVLTKPSLTSELCEKIPIGSSVKNIALNSGSNLISQEKGLWTSSTATNFDQPNGVFSNALDVPTGKHTFVWTIQNQVDTTCQLSDTTLARVISQASAGSDSCLIKPVENTTLKANEPTLSEKGVWKILAPQGQFLVDTNSYESAVLKAPAGISQYRWFIYNETCIDSSDVRVSVQTKSNAGPDFAMCSDTAILAGNSFASDETGIWNLPNQNLLLADSTNRASEVYRLVPGNNFLIWTIKNSICQNSDTINVINNQPSLVNISTPDQETCFTANVLSGNKAANEIATAKSTWRIISQPSNNNPKVIINTADSDSTIVRNLNVAGDYVFTYNIYNSVCDTIRDTVTIIRNESLYNYAIGPKTACISDTILLEGQIAPVDGEGKWILSGGYGTFENILSNITKVYNLGANQNLFYWRLKRGECENIQSVIVEGYNQPSPAVILSKSEKLCQIDSIVLEATDPVIGNGMWSIESGSAKIDSPTSNVTKVTSIGLGRNVFKWTCSSGPCDTNSATVVIERFAEETKANAGKDTLLCGNSLVLNANAPISGNGSWRILQGSLNVVNPTSPTSQVTNIEYKKNILIWSIINGTCISSDTISITAEEAVDQAKTQDDITVCGVNNIQISANNPKSGVGQWMLPMGGNLFNRNANVTIIQNLVSDTSIYEWVIKKGFCESRDTLMIVNYKEPANANAGPDQNIYTTSTYLEAVKPVYGQGTWQTLDQTVEISDTSDQHTYVSNITKGSAAFVWTVQNGICPVTSDTVIVYFNNFRIPNAFSPNNDGKNDHFEIKGLHEYAPADLVIFNRWNEVVFSSKDYQNDWKGQNNNGKELVDDTYFYILTLANNEVYQGYIILKRN